MKVKLKNPGQVFHDPFAQVTLHGKEVFEVKATKPVMDLLHNGSLIEVIAEPKDAKAQAAEDKKAAAAKVKETTATKVAEKA